MKNTLFGIFLTTISEGALAHVKWFVPYEMQNGPLPLDVIVNTQFVVLFALSIIVVFGSYVADGIYHQFTGLWRNRIEYVKNNLLFFDSFELIKIALAIFFASIAVSGFILTPELKHETGWIPFVQIFMVVCLFYKKTIWLSGVGIIFLFSYSVIHYSLFHLSDYIIFIGFALFLILSGSSNQKILNYRLPLLYASLSVTLLWASIEKFTFPEWSITLISQHPEITFGIEPSLFICIAGFVEFTLAFMILTGRLLVLVSAFILFCMFVAAIAEFGLIDAIGHLPIISALVVIMLEGQQKYMVNFTTRFSVFGLAVSSTGIFIMMLVAFFSLYYGIYAISY